MIYNIDFELSALAMLIIVAVNMLYKHRVLPTAKNKVFTLLLWAGSLDILLDLISTVFIAYPEHFPVWLQSSTLHLFYIMQLLMPFIFFNYEMALRGFHWKDNSAVMSFFSLPFVFMLIMVATNPFTKLIFSFSEGEYTRNSMYSCMYIYALLYLFATLIDTFVHRKKLRRRDIFAIREFMLINIFTVSVQLFFNNILLTGVGIGISLIILLITVNNPSEKCDTLTGLFDQSSLRDALTEELRLAQEIRVIAVIFEGIKTINSVFGMEEGNRQLKSFAAMLTDAVGSENAFRYVGNRFMVVCKSEQAYDSARRKITDYFKDSHRINDVDMIFGAYICGIPNTEKHRSAEEIIDFTEYLLRKTKEADNGMITLADSGSDEAYFRRKEIENYLYKAIKDELFELNLQPLYSLKEEKFISAEALARLKHPYLGNIPPSEFIAIAESGGLITQLERCILKKVCEFMRDNLSVCRKLNSIKINHSPASFLNINLARETIAAIGEYGLPCLAFQFEITENLAGKYDSNIIDWAQAIKKSGAGLCLDDFGSGYANIDSVMQLPFDVVKFDRSMLTEAKKDARSKALYRETAMAMIDLGYEVVAEGVEEKEDVELLKEFGIGCIQGYYYSRPLKPEDFTELINKQA